jgi:predicted RNase H-like HicB family nuclease
MRYGIVIEKGAKNYSAYVPDLPGCVSTGRTVDELRRNIQEAIELHLEGLQKDGDPIPPPTTLCEYIDAQAA